MIHSNIQLLSRRDRHEACEEDKKSQAVAQVMQKVSYRRQSASSVVTAAKVFFQPNIETDEKITTAHFLDSKLGRAAAAVTPGNGNHGPGIAADNGFKWNLNRKIKMRREKRATTFYHFPPIGFEGVG
jgi:hypothetical protein